jgi:hypothetical protein
MRMLLVALAAVTAALVEVQRGREALVCADLRPRGGRRADVRIRELGAMSRDNGPHGRILSAQSRPSQRGGRTPPPKRAATTQAQVKSTELTGIAGRKHALD